MLVKMQREILNGWPRFACWNVFISFPYSDHSVIVVPMTRKKEITFPIACIGLHFYLPAFIVILRVFRIVMGCLTAPFVQSMEL